MAGMIISDEKYVKWLQELKSRYQQSQIAAFSHINQEMLRFYYSIGRDIVIMDVENQYGTRFYDRLSHDLKKFLPDSSGFSRQNLQYMKKMYLFYNQPNKNCPQLAGNSSDESVDEIIFSIPWGHHRILIDKFFAQKDLSSALFYIKKTVKEGWSRSILKIQIESSLHLRQGKAISSFLTMLPKPQSDLAQGLTRDPYIFDFTQLTEPFKERELKKALMKNITRFLLELGSGFAYIGEEYKLNVGSTEQFIDLLFYNVKLHAYCVIEIKTGTFSPGDIGQLGTYMTAVNHLLKTENDNPTIGLLICKDRDSVLAQYALESSSQPIGVAEFQMTKFIPDEFKSSLPSIEEIELQLNHELK